ncbi:unnamed protein product [Closterium sp. NIES-65]|nr:unnamed protein product [Closterium sp. NIES-65]
MPSNVLRAQQIFQSPQPAPLLLTPLLPFPLPPSACPQDEDPPDPSNGAGLSTAAGIPDFRGPKGVWTLQGEGKWEEAAAAMGRKYEEASPTVGHMAVAALVRAGIVQHVVTQNGKASQIKSHLSSPPQSSIGAAWISVPGEVPGDWGQVTVPSYEVTFESTQKSPSGQVTVPSSCLFPFCFPFCLPTLSPRSFSQHTAPHQWTAFTLELHGLERCLGVWGGVSLPLTSPLPVLPPVHLPSSPGDGLQSRRWHHIKLPIRAAWVVKWGTFPAHLPLTSPLPILLPVHLPSSPVDGLHSRSCIPSRCLSELHGSVYRERCRELDGLHSRSGIPSDSLSELHGWWSGVPFPLTSLSLPIYPYSLPSTFPPTVDGLHSRSGIPSHRLSELHGSVYRESCRECGAGYPRSSAAVRARMSAGGAGGVKEENREVLVGEGRKRHEPGKASFELTQKSAQMSTGGGGYVKEENQEVLLGERRKWHEPGAATLEDSEGIPRAMVRDYHKEGDYARMEDEEGVRRWRETEEKQQREGGGKNEEVTRVCEGRGAQEEEQAEVTKGGEEREEEGGEERHEGGAVCGGELVDSIVHFGERIDDEELRTAREASMGAHVALCLGSSFKVRLSGGGPFKSMRRLAGKEVVGAAQADGPTHPLSVSSLNPPGPTSIKLPLLAIHICGINVHHAPCLPTTPLACPPRPLLAHYAPCTTPLACPPRPLLAHHAPCLPTTPLACPPRPLLAHHAPCLPTTPLACPPRPLLAHHAPCLPTTPLACPPRPLLAHHAPCLPTTSLACPPRPLLAHHALRLPLPLTSETSQRSLPAVPPASKLPRLAAHVVIINLQRTPLDRHASITIRARIDAVLPRLLHLLHLPLPAYNRHADPLLSLSSTPLHSITHAPRLPLFCTPPPSLLLKLSTQAAEEKGKEVNSDSPLKDNVPGATGDSTRPILFLHKATGTKGRRKKQKARTSFPRPTM